MNIIALNANYDYIDKVETTIKSILFHNHHVKIHVINSDIPHEWFVNLNQYLNQFGASVIDDKIDPNMLRDLHPSYNRIKSIAYGRFFIPDLIKEDKVLYLDSDLIVDANLDKLFKVNVENKAIYAVRDYHETDQFNSGVMLINNKKWREEHLREKLVEKGGEPNLLNGDQTVINEVLKDQIGELDLSYNYQIGFEKDAYWNDLHTVFSNFEKVKVPKIIHYVSEDKPFNVISTSSLREKWWDYHNLQWIDLVNKYTNFDKKQIGRQKFDGEAFLFTHVAETHEIERLIQKAPNIKFNIAAYTNVAWLLEHLTKYDNVHLYPTIVPSQLNKLIDNADMYLDINYGSKEEPVLKRMMLKNTPILAFEATKSNNLNYQNYYTFDNEASDQLIDKMQALIKSFNDKKDHYFDIHVKDIDQSLDLILKDKKSVVRFGDGEFDLIRGDSIPYQNYDEKLAARLKAIILKGNLNNTLVCLPDVFENMERYGHYAQDFYNGTFFPRNASFLREIETTNNWYGSTFISRPYIDLVDKSKSAQYFDKLKKLWNKQDLLIVEGAYTRSGVDNDLFDNANSVKRIICPSKNSFEKINEIEKEIRKYADDRLVLLMLGPTAKVIVDDLHQVISNQLIDMGHIDSEYEWFKMGATEKVKLKNKHTAEFNFDNNIEAIEDTNYSKEIVARIKG